MNATTPSALRWLIGVELRHHREAARRPMTAAAALLNCAESKISHMESGRYRQSPEDIARLMRFYEADQHAADRLVALAAQDDESTWWAPFADVVPDWLSTFVGLERLADEEFTYEPLVLPGLLQTEEYAAAITAASRRVRPDHAARLVEFRLARQGRLDADAARPLVLTAVVEETALRRPIGSPAVRRAQLEHLLALADQPNIRLHVVPQTVAVHAALAGRFTLLMFSGVRPIGFVELSDGGVYRQKPAEVSAYTMTAESLVSDALDRRATRSLITSLVGELS
ncbi:helix-turn-helix domain-containing protein [Actinosynnema sp. NPDC004786]